MSYSSKVLKIVEKVKNKIAKNMINHNMFENLIKKNVSNIEFYPSSDKFSYEFEIIKPKINKGEYSLDDIEEFLILDEGVVRKTYDMLKNIKKKYKDLNARHSSSLSLNSDFKHNSNDRTLGYIYDGFDDLNSGVSKDGDDVKVPINSKGKVVDGCLDGVYYFYITLDPNMEEQDIRTVSEIIKGFAEKI